MLEEKEIKENDTYILMDPVIATKFDLEITFK